MIESHHAVLPETLPLRSAVEIAIRDRGERVREACMLAAISLVAPVVFTVAWPLRELYPPLSFVGTLGYLGLGVSAGLQYAAAVRIMGGGGGGRDVSVFLFAAFFPLWGPILFVMSVFAGGPVVCSGLWGGMMSGRIPWRRASRLGLTAGGSSLGGGFLALVGGLVYWQDLRVDLMLGAAAMVWHVVMAGGLVLAGCRGYCERRAGAAECVGCGYDLVGLPEGIVCCPECGLEVLGGEGSSDRVGPLLP